jgi:FSR family fosmidomycin resistance protein-like MFS transporter
VTDLHHSKAAGDFAVTAYMAAGVAGTYIGGRLADRFGHRVVALWGFVAATPLTLLYLAFPGAVFLLLPAGVALYVPFGILVGLGQRYLPNRPGVAGGVTLGLSASIGGVAAPLFGLLSAHALERLPAAATSRARRTRTAAAATRRSPSPGAPAEPSLPVRPAR